MLGRNDVPWGLALGRFIHFVDAGLVIMADELDMYSYELDMYSST